MPSTIAYIGLGSNQGDRLAMIFAALKLLDEMPGVVMGILSQIIETAPLGGPVNQENYLNCVVQANFTGTADELLANLQAVENHLGRRRKAKWGPRNIDLDLLLFGDEIIDKPHLQVPHPQMHLRRFVMEPLVQIAPDAIHPQLVRTMKQLLAELEDQQ